MRDRTLNRCTDVKVSAADTLKSASLLQRVPRSIAHRFIRRGKADEVIDAIAKTVAGMTSQQDGLIRQQVIEHLMQQIMQYDGEFRQEEASSAVSSYAKH